MEAHEGVFNGVVFDTLDMLFKHILWYGIVDIQQGNSVTGNADANVFRKCTIDIYLTSNRNASGNETAIYIARLKAELAWEGWPALVSKGYIFAGTFVSFHPIQESQFILSHTWQ